MSAGLRLRPMSITEFLTWDESQVDRHEFDGVGPVAMVGGTRGHATITRNLLGLLWQALRGKPCEPFGGNLRAEIDGSLRYPDALVCCSPGDRGDVTVRDPVVVFEVLSPSTAMIDTTVKNSEYRAATYIQRYVMLDQDRVRAMVFSGSDWRGSLIEGDGAALDMPEIGVTLRLADLYEGVTFAPPPVPA